MEHVRCAQCRNPIRGRQAFVTHARSNLSFHSDCWLDLHQRVQAEYTVTVAADGIDGLLAPYSRNQMAAWLPSVAIDAAAEQLADMVVGELADQQNPSLPYKIDFENAVTERGDSVGHDKHDILTGSRPDGTAYPGTGDLTCGNWTSSSRGRAQVGHFDRGGDNPREKSWNSAHATRGCSNDDFTSTGGAGLFYCFAID